MRHNLNFIDFGISSFHREKKSLILYLGVFRTHLKKFSILIPFVISQAKSRKL